MKEPIPKMMLEDGKYQEGSDLSGSRGTGAAPDMTFYKADEKSRRLG